MASRPSPYPDRFSKITQKILDAINKTIISQYTTRDNTNEYIQSVIYTVAVTTLVMSGQTLEER